MKFGYKYCFKRFAAFTLPEVVISMLLIAILFNFGIVIYMIISKQLQESLKKNQFYSHYYITQKVMHRDIEKAFVVTVTEGNKTIRLQMNRKGFPADNIYYKMDSTYIIRVHDKTVDTLLPGGVIATYKNLNDTLQLTGYIKVEHKYQGKHFFTYLEKEYATAQILSYDPKL